MQQSIDDGSGHHLVGEAPIARQDDRPLLVPPAYYLKDPVGGVLIEREIAQFINDDEGRIHVGPKLVVGGRFELRRLQCVRQIYRNSEIGPIARLGGGDAEGDREVGLADAVL